MSKLIYPDFSEFKALAKDYNFIPVCREVYSDSITPAELTRKLKAVSAEVFILESAENREVRGRYTFLGYSPKEEIADDVKTLEATLKKYRAPRSLNASKTLDKTAELPPFTGGLVGYFSYEFINEIEPELKLNSGENPNSAFKKFELSLFDKIFVFDNLRQKIIIIANAYTDNINLEEAYNKAVSELEKALKIITDGEKAEIPKLKLTSPFTEYFSKAEYCELVNRAKKYIYEGDIFQAVLSNRFEAEAEGSLFDAYRVMRSVNPSPYMFYFDNGALEIAGASPETLVKLTGNQLYSFPIAGTRPRGLTPEEDLALEKSLLADEKELSEHNMLVDLGRNDLGKISRFGTVKVGDYMKIVRFSRVMHIASSVTGEILPDKTALDAIKAVLPAGTLSGAPKLRACEIIGELENSKGDNPRGIYGGALGYLAFTGDMDVCISIRLAFKQNGKIVARSGAGIVADSVPEKEYEECVHKAKATVSAAEVASEGII